MLGAGLTFLACSIAPASAQLHYTVLHSFTQGEGAVPDASLVMDNAGNFYGTTRSGGNNNAGTVFRLDPNGNLITLHEFDGTNGASPLANVTLDKAGNLYGTFSQGGSPGCAYGCGGIFRIDASGTYSVLYFFQGGSDGATPMGDLLLDKSGNLFGTTRYGGMLDKGTVFELPANGTLTILHRFSGFPDGDSPFSGLVTDGAGTLYGTTEAGGTAFNYGTIFKINRAGEEAVIYRFTGAAEGAYPYENLILDDIGNLYGTTIGGGGSGGGFGYGVVFKLDVASNLTVLHTFTTGSPDGLEPVCRLLRDQAGNLYGTTFLGGVANFGTVFRLEPSGRFRLLHSFLGGMDGAKPAAGLIRDSVGTLYGTTAIGGSDNNGTIFKITLLR
jgi:uncharacterized repeat protein (TIGR03803 family)